MAIRMNLGGMIGMLPEEHDTVWVWSIDPPWVTHHLGIVDSEKRKKIIANWDQALADLNGYERYWVKHGGWARKADCQKFIKGLKKKYGYQVFKLIEPRRTGVWDQRIEAKNAVKSKSMDW